MKKIPIEELFRKELQNYREAPPSEVWTGISKRLAARRRRKAAFLWGGTLSGCILLTAALFWIRKTPSQPNPILSNLQNLEQPAKAQSEVSAPLFNSTNAHSAAPTQGNQNQRPEASFTLRVPNPAPERLASPTRANQKVYGSHPVTEPTPIPIKITEESINTIESHASTDANVLQEDPNRAVAETLKNEEKSGLKKASENSEEHMAEAPELKPATTSDSKCKKWPLYVGITYEAGSMWRLMPQSATPNAWMPESQVEHLASAKGGTSTSFSDVIQAIQLMAGYRFGEALSVQMAIGHTRIGHFESGSLLERSLPSDGRLGLMTETGAWKVGPEAVSDSMVRMKKLSQQFSFITLSPGVLYQHHLKNWVVGFNAQAHAHILAGNRAEATFAQSVHTYKHEGLRPVAFSLSAGASVGYRLQKLVLSVGFQGGYWLTPLSRSGFAGSRYIHLGVRPALMYHF
ncbi:MAG: hypothetical protein N2050_06230 [Flavobacteriales bacterium]|nr:hypothetical protein [Flavobacteriales bacterium]